MTGHELQTKITNSGMTTEEVMADLGISRTTLWRWLKRGSKPIPRHAPAVIQTASPRLHRAKAA